MQTNILWKCTLKRVLWIILMAIITTAGIITFTEYEKHYIGIILIMLGLGLYFYKMKTWKSYLNEIG